MHYAIWYGLACWFSLLKACGVAPFAGWGWSVALCLAAWPTLCALGRLARRSLHQERPAHGYGFNTLRHG